jgi:SAM-dependent methyltransferase
LKIPFSVKIYLFLKSIYYFPSFILDYVAFKKKNTGKRFELSVAEWFPCLTDKTSTTPFEPHYTYHPAWAARKVKEIHPEVHFDISSTLTFVTIVSAFVPIKFYDYRKAILNLSDLESGEADLYKLPFKDGSIRSLSCMHVVEHIGLGRYGDPIDPNGDLVAIKELKRVLAHGGSLLFVVPIGRPKIAFNAHRIYSYKQIRGYFNDMVLKEFSMVPDDFKETGMIYNASEELADQQEWGCGCFWFIKK